MVPPRGAIEISHIPNSLRSAGRELRLSLLHPLQQLPREQFVRAWSAVAYLFPGLPPDGYEDAESGWPRALKRFAAEAWRRADAGELADEEFIAPTTLTRSSTTLSRSRRRWTWSGLYDRMHTHESDEMERRLALAFEHGEVFAE